VSEELQLEVKVAARDLNRSAIITRGILNRPIDLVPCLAYVL